MFDNFTLVHYCDLIRNFSDDGKIMGDKQIADIFSLL